VLILVARRGQTLFPGKYNSSYSKTVVTCMQTIIWGNIARILYRLELNQTPSNLRSLQNQSYLLVLVWSQCALINVNVRVPCLQTRKSSCKYLHQISFEELRMICVFFSIQYWSLLNWHNLRLRGGCVAVPVNLYFCIISSSFFLNLRTLYIVWRQVRRRVTRRLTRLQTMCNVIKHCKIL